MKITLDMESRTCPIVTVNYTEFALYDEADKVLYDLLPRGIYSVKTTRTRGYRKIATYASLGYKACIHDTPAGKMPLCESTLHSLFGGPPAEFYVRRLSKPKQ